MASLNELYESSPELTLNHLRIAIREARENPDNEGGLAWEKLTMIPAILNMTLQLMPKSLEDLVELTPNSLSLHPVHKNALAVNHGGSTHILLGSKDLDCCPLLALAVFMETRDVFPRGSESLLLLWTISETPSRSRILSQNLSTMPLVGIRYMVSEFGRVPWAGRKEGRCQGKEARRPEASECQESQKNIRFEERRRSRYSTRRPWSHRVHHS